MLRGKYGMVEYIGKSMQPRLSWEQGWTAYWVNISLGEGDYVGPPLVPARSGYVCRTFFDSGFHTGGNDPNEEFFRTPRIFRAA